MPHFKYNTTQAETSSSPRSRKTHSFSPTQKVSNTLIYLVSFMNSKDIGRCIVLNSDSALCNVLGLKVCQYFS